MSSFWMPNKKPLYAPMIASFGGGSSRGFGRSFRTLAGSLSGTALDLFNAIVDNGGDAAGEKKTEVVVYDLPSQQTLFSYLQSFGVNESSVQPDAITNTPKATLNLSSSANVDTANSFFAGNPSYSATQYPDTSLSLKVVVSDNSGNDAGDWVVFGWGDVTLNGDWSAQGSAYTMLGELSFIDDEAAPVVGHNAYHSPAGGIYGFDGTSWYPLFILTSQSTVAFKGTPELWTGSFASFVSSGEGVYQNYTTKSISKIAFATAKDVASLNIGTLSGGVGVAAPVVLNTFLSNNFTVSAQGTDSVEWTDFNNPTLVADTAATPYTGADFWRLLRITAGSTGTKRLVFRNEIIASAGAAPRDQFYNADIQIAAVAIAGSSPVEYRFTESQNNGFETVTTFSTGSASQIEPTSWVSVEVNTTQGDTTAGKWGVRDGVTSSTVTGRLSPPIPAFEGTNVFSYLYSETSSPVAFGDYVWGRSPALSLQAGDVVDILIGIDAPTSARFFAELK